MPSHKSLLDQRVSGPILAHSIHVGLNMPNINMQKEESMRQMPGSPHTPTVPNPSSPTVAILAPHLHLSCTVSQSQEEPRLEPR